MALRLPTPRMLLLLSALPLAAMGTQQPLGRSINSPIPSQPPSDPPAIHGTVVVYGATAAGCMAAIAASRTGARSVVLAATGRHVGGMTTGGIMHADSANTSTIAGLTLEFFQRVLRQYPPPPPPSPPSPPHFHYECRAQRCLQVEGVGPSVDPICGGHCARLEPTEWLAVTFLSVLSNGNRTLTVTLPAGQEASYVKKSELLERDLPPAMYHGVKQGQVLQLASPALVVDQTYYLINTTDLAPARVQRAAFPWNSGALPAGLHPGSPGQIGPPWLYESHVAEQVRRQLLSQFRPGCPL